MHVWFHIFSHFCDFSAFRTFQKKHLTFPELVWIFNTKTKPTKPAFSHSPTLRQTKGRWAEGDNSQGGEKEPEWTRVEAKKDQRQSVA